VPGELPPENLTAFEVEGFLANRLETNPRLVEVLGAGKVFPVFLPASALLPAVTCERAGTIRSYTTQGEGAERTATFKLICWARSNREGYATNIAAAQAIDAAISGLQTAAKDSQQRNHYIRRVTIEDERDEDDAPIFADGVETFQRVLMVKIAYVRQTRKLIGGG
jgi:hypothetical protein